MTRYTTSGTHKAEFSGVPATGKQMRWNEQPIYRVLTGSSLKRGGWQTSSA